MSLFDVHVNRAPVDGKVVFRDYRPGKFRNAMSPAASRENECSLIGIERPEISIAQLADKVIATAQELFDYRGKHVRKVSAETDYLLDNPSRRCPVIEKAKSHLGYNPSILIDEGLRRSLIWYHYNREAEEA